MRSGGKWNTSVLSLLFRGRYVVVTALNNKELSLSLSLLWRRVEYNTAWNEREKVGSRQGMGTEMEAGRRETGTGDETRLSSSGYRYFAKVLIYLSFLLLPSPHVVYFRGGGLRYRPNRFVIHWSTSRRAVEPSLPASHGWNAGRISLANETISSILLFFFFLNSVNLRWK